MKSSLVIGFAIAFSNLFAYEDFYPVLFQHDLERVDSIKITCGRHCLKSISDFATFELDEFPLDSLAINTVIKNIENRKVGHDLDYKWEVRFILTISASKMREIRTTVNNIKTTKKGLLTKLVTDSHTYRFCHDREGRYSKASILLHGYSIEWCTTPKKYLVEYHYNNSGRIDQIRTVMEQIGWSRNYQMIIEYHE